jgi:TRAP-type C4-dicarboxylate transport system permease small subunit
LGVPDTIFMTQVPTFIRWFDALMSAFCTAFAVTFGVFTLMVCVDIVCRRFGIASMPWLVEMIEYVMYGGTFLAAPWVLRQGEHVRVDLVLSSVPRLVAIRLEQIVDALGFFVSVVMSYYGVALLVDAYRSNFIQYKSLAVPEWILIAPLPLGCAMLAIEFVLRFFRVRGDVEKTVIPIEVPGMET